MSNKKQTAVEFAVEKLAKFIPSGKQLVIHIILEQAKELEKRQIFEAIDFGYKLEDISITKEQYYTETFNK